jgi:hypothetical protein
MSLPVGLRDGLSRDGRIVDLVPPPRLLRVRAGLLPTLNTRVLTRLVVLIAGIGLSAASAAAQQQTDIIRGRVTLSRIQLFRNDQAESRHASLERGMNIRQLCVGTRTRER